jgi:hypothetical protein
MLASGGNDNKLYVWDVQRSTTTDAPRCRFEDHTAAGEEDVLIKQINDSDKLN